MAPHLRIYGSGTPLRSTTGKYRVLPCASAPSWTGHPFARVWFGPISPPHGETISASGSVILTQNRSKPSSGSPAWWFGHPLLATLHPSRATAAGLRPILGQDY